jgi:hypothetical protein
MLSVARPASQPAHAFTVKWTDQTVAKCVPAAGMQVYRIEGSQLAETSVTLAGLGMERPGGAEKLDEPAAHEVRGRS